MSQSVPPRILLVEDDPVSRDVVSALLAARGYVVDEEADGFGALRCAQEHVHDVIFIDYHLPEMDGYALARLMRTLANKSGSEAKMVAITADAFGLAARRGADNVFDRIISKPINPDKLYAFCDALFPPLEATIDIDAFLSDAERESTVHAADTLWRIRGLPQRPAVLVFPEPGASEREALEYCFRLVAPAQARAGTQADALLMLSHKGLPLIERLRAEAEPSLAPLLALDPALCEMVDGVFLVDDSDSWSAAAALIERFRARRDDLLPEACADVDLRLCAYLYLADRPLIIRRGADGRANLPYTAGFDTRQLVATAKRLTAAGTLVAKPAASGDASARELAISLTTKGQRMLLSENAIRRAADRVA